MKPKNLKLLVLFSSFFISTVAFAQKEDPRQFDLKLYYNFKYSIVEEQTTDSLNIYNSTAKNSLFGNLSPSLLIHNEKSMHEFEISDISFGKTDYLLTRTYTNMNITGIIDGYEQRFFNLNLKYEYIYQLSGKEKNYAIMLGASVEPYINRNVFTPRVRSNYKTSQFISGAKVSIIPRGIISLSKKFYIDINFPIELTDMYLNRVLTENPALPKEEMQNSNIEIELFNIPVQLRIGFGIKL